MFVTTALPVYGIPFAIVAASKRLVTTFSFRCAHILAIAAHGGPQRSGVALQTRPVPAGASNFGGSAGEYMRFDNSLPAWAP